MRAVGDDRTKPVGVGPGPSSVVVAAHAPCAEAEEHHEHARGHVLQGPEQGEPHELSAELPGPQKLREQTTDKT